MICPNCEREFEKKARCQKFCCPTCRLTYYNKHYKRKAYEVKVKHKTKFFCQHCNFLMTLKFDPLKCFKEFEKIVCPKCKNKKHD